MKLSLLITILLSSLLFACASEQVKDDKSEVRTTSIGAIEEVKDIAFFFYNASIIILSSTIQSDQ